MASIYKRRRSRTIPKGAEITERQRRARRGEPPVAERWAHWTDQRGRRGKAQLNDAGDRILVGSGSYVISYFDETGQRKEVNARTTDRAVAEQIVAKLEGEVALRRRGIIDPATDRFSQEARRPLEEHVSDFRKALVDRENTSKHVEMTDARVRWVIAHCHAAHSKDLTPSVVQCAVKSIHDSGRSLETANSYLRAIKGFTRWLRHDRRCADDPLATLAAYNTAVEAQHHARREIEAEELNYLLGFVETYTKPAHALNGPNRRMLYQIAAGTGFRANELRSLTPESFDLMADPPTITVDAAYSKRRRRDVQPIRMDLAKLLTPWLEGRPRDERVFDRMPQSMAKKLGRDLRAARATWIAEAHDAEEQRVREQSQFLRNRDADDRVVDFHALRHTYISGIVAGGASVKTAQTLARHSTPVLTIGRYSHARLHDLTGALEGLPEVGALSPEPEAMTKQATGTDGRQTSPKWAADGQQSSGKTQQNVAISGNQPAEQGSQETHKASDSRAGTTRPNVLAIHAFGRFCRRPSGSGGHGARTRNSLRNTSFRVRSRTDVGSKTAMAAVMVVFMGSTIWAQQATTRRTDLPESAVWRCPLQVDVAFEARIHEQGRDGLLPVKLSAALLLLSAGHLGGVLVPGHTICVEAESFEDRGGWVIDQQAMDVMGSPVLLAHGLGVPVRDAVTSIDVPVSGRYRVWVRTRDWVAPWHVPGSPGRFQVIVDGASLKPDFGTANAAWHWQDGGVMTLSSPRATVALHDLTGFCGRCDALVFSLDVDFRPPNQDPAMAEFRRTCLGLPDEPPDAGEYDLVVVGGGMAGCCAAVSAARLGCKVALIQNRPVLGGNNSSEVRVGLSGLIHQQPYPRLGDLVDEISPVGHWNLWEATRDPESPRSKQILDVIRAHPEKKIHNAGPASNYEDQKKRQIVEAEHGVSLFLNTHVCRVERDANRISAVIGKSIVTGRELRFSGRWFADCTGDGNLGFLSGADYRTGREARSETNESRAPEFSDQLVMGTSVQWYTVEEADPSPFPECPWAVPFDETTCQRLTRGDWDWETGMNRDQVTEIELIRDYALRVTFGNWAFLKNQSSMKQELVKRRLAWVAYIGGKRESRRLLGDVILQQQDVVEQRPYPDACVTTTWTIDLHFPHPDNSRYFPGEEFRSVARHTNIKPYPIPYRCLFSRNVENLMMAGRDISVTHVALGTVRVQRTTGMMGEVVGMAVSLCKQYDTVPRGVYQDHLGELQRLMRRGVGKALSVGDRD